MRILLTMVLLVLAVPDFACSGNHEASNPSTTTATTSTPDTPAPAPSSGG